MGKWTDGLEKLLGLMLVVAIAAIVASMWPRTADATALSANRQTAERSGDVVTLTVKNDAVIYAGSIVGIDTGEAIAAVDATNMSAVVGMALEYVNNADDGLTIDVARGVFRWANGASITDANIGTFATCADDQTVSLAATTTADKVVGEIIDVDSSGVWVDTRHRQ